MSIRCFQQFLTVLTVFSIYDLVTTVVSTAAGANLLFEATRLSTHFPSLHFIEFEPHHRNFHALRRGSGFFLPTKIYLKRNSQEDGKKQSNVVSLSNSLGSYRFFFAKKKMENCQSIIGLSHETRGGHPQSITLRPRGHS